MNEFHAMNGWVFVAGFMVGALAATVGLLYLFAHPPRIRPEDDEWYEWVPTQPGACCCTEFPVVRGSYASWTCPVHGFMVERNRWPQ